MMAYHVPEEGIRHGFDVRVLQRCQDYHLGKSVHGRHDGGVSVVGRQVRDEVNMDLLPGLLRNRERLIQPCWAPRIRLRALADVAGATVAPDILPHARPVELGAQHGGGPVHPKVPPRVMELMQKRRNKCTGYKQPIFKCQELSNGIF